VLRSALPLRYVTPMTSGHAGRFRLSNSLVVEPWAARNTDLGGYAEWLDSERIVGNLRRAYYDLEPTTDAIDVYGTLADMVAFNSGKPLSCYA
jgi:hypothetical protein